MNKYSLLILLLGLLLPLSSCAQKKQAPAAKKQEPAGVSVVNLPAQLPAKQVLENIIKAYKGQVAVIDFWATWCPPCRAAMKQIDPIKEQYLKDKKKVAFIYVTGETSPLATWNESIKNIKGYHYRLTDDQYNQLLGGLGIKGIPTYMIVGKDGQRAWDNIQTGGYPGDDVIVEQIEKALNKQ